MVTVTIVVFKQATLVALPYPRNTESFDDPLVLEQIHCTDTVEKALLEVYAHLSDTQSAVVSTECTYESSNTNVITVEIENNVDVVVQPGVAYYFFSFANLILL